MHTMTNEFMFDIYEDVRETNRYDEDGERIIRWRYYVRVCAKDGRRWMSPYVHEEEVSARSERRHILKKVVGFNPETAGWQETWPVYGSMAWGSDHEHMLSELDRH